MPSVGATLVVLNHPNGLVDALVPAALLEPPPRFIGKATLWQVAVLRPFIAVFDPIPVHRRQDGDVGADATARTFAAVHAALARGESVAMFPEGISHGARELAPLKTGAARIVLSSPVPVRLVPAGLVYGARETFRHSALLRIGTPIEHGDLRDRGLDPAAVRELTERIRRALEPLTLHGADDDIAHLAERVAWLLAEAPADRTDLERVRARVRWLEPRLRELDAPALEQLRAGIDAAATTLRAAGLRPDQIDDVYTRDAVAHWLPRFAVRVVLSPIMLVIGAPFWPAYRLTGTIIDRLALDRDVQATYKLLLGLVLMPAWALALVVLAGWRFGVAAAVAVVVAAVLAFFALPLAERVREDVQAIRGFLRRGDPRTQALRVERERLLAAFPELAAPERAG